MEGGFDEALRFAGANGRCVGTLAEQEILWNGLVKLAAEGVTVIASTSERAAVPLEVTTIEMEALHA